MLKLNKMKSISNLRANRLQDHRHKDLPLCHLMFRADHNHKVLFLIFNNHHLGNSCINIGSSILTINQANLKVGDVAERQVSYLPNEELMI